MTQLLPYADIEPDETLSLETTIATDIAVEFGFLLQVHLKYPKEEKD